MTNSFRGENSFEGVDVPDYSDEIIYKHPTKLNPVQVKKNFLKSIAEESSQDNFSSLPSDKHSE
jgi:hypothetical protein